MPHPGGRGASTTQGQLLAQEGIWAQSCKLVATAVMNSAPATAKQHTLSTVYDGPAKHGKTFKYTVPIHNPREPIKYHVCMLSHVPLCNPRDCSPPGSSVHGLSQARVLEWAAISSSRGSSRPRDQTCISCTARGFFTTEPPGKTCQGL